MIYNLTNKDLSDWSSVHVNPFGRWDIDELYWMMRYEKTLGDLAYE